MNDYNSRQPSNVNPSASSSAPDVAEVATSTAVMRVQECRGALSLPSALKKKESKGDTVNTITTHQRGENQVAQPNGVFSNIMFVQRTKWNFIQRRLDRYLPRNAWFHPRPTVDKVVGMTLHCFVLSMGVMLVLLVRLVVTIGHFFFFLLLHTVLYTGNVKPILPDRLKSSSMTKEELNSATIYRMGDLRLLLARVESSHCKRAQSSIDSGNASGSKSSYSEHQYSDSHPHSICASHSREDYCVCSNIISCCSRSYHQQQQLHQNQPHLRQPQLGISQNNRAKSRSHNNLLSNSMSSSSDWIPRYENENCSIASSPSLCCSMSETFSSSADPHPISRSNSSIHERLEERHGVEAHHVHGRSIRQFMAHSSSLQP